VRILLLECNINTHWAWRGREDTVRIERVRLGCILRGKNDEEKTFCPAERVMPDPSEHNRTVTTRR